MAEREIVCLTALESVLNKEFPSRCYALGKYSEDAVCLEQTGSSKWDVYYGLRNTKDQLATFNNVVSACLELIHKLCDNDETEAILGNAFLDQIIVKRTA